MENIKGFEDDIYGSEIDISVFLLPIILAAKKIVMMKNQLISQKEADLMFDDEKTLEEKEEKAAENADAKAEDNAKKRDAEKGETPEKSDEKTRIRDAKKRKRKALRKARRERYKQIFKDLIPAIIAEAERLIDEFVQKCMNIWKDLKRLVQAVINTIIQTASSIPAIAMCMAAPPFNIPLGISYLIVIIECYLTILQIIKGVVPYFSIFKYLPLVTDKKGLNIISKIFNVIVTLLRALWKPLSFLNKLIVSLIKRISDFLKKNRQRIFRKATKRLKKFGHLYRRYITNPGLSDKPRDDNGNEIDVGPLWPAILTTRPYLRGDRYEAEEGVRDYPCYAFDEEDIDEIQGLLDTFIVGFENNKQQNRVVAYRRKVTTDSKDFALLAGKDATDETDFAEFDLDDLADKFENLPLPDINPEPDTDPDEVYSYAIELPDGTIIKNITEEGVEFYRQTYVLKYMNAYEQVKELIKQNAPQ